MSGSFHDTDDFAVLGPADLIVVPLKESLKTRNWSGRSHAVGIPTRAQIWIGAPRKLWGP